MQVTIEISTVEEGTGNHNRRKIRLSKELSEKLNEWIDEVDEFPGTQLKFIPKDKKQGTRLVKVECSECGYVCRVTRKWLDEVGPPHCPEHGEMAEA